MINAFNVPTELDTRNIAVRFVVAIDTMYFNEKNGTMHSGPMKPVRLTHRSETSHRHTKISYSGYSSLSAVHRSMRV